MCSIRVRLSAILCLVLSALAATGCGDANSGGHEGIAPTASGSATSLPRTFHRDIAPIVFGHCAACHRPDGSAPFSLLAFADVKNRGKQIAKVTKSRFMPPWLPRGGDYEFAGDCHLSDGQIDTIQQWVASGGVEGNPADSPPRPQWREGWLLGEPDLVVQMPKAYHLAPGGTDVWRRFVVPVPLSEPRYVRAVEIRPGNKKIVHHAIAYIDSTTFSRRLDSKDGEPGYDGMVSSSAVHSPDGHFLSWLPGMIPFAEDPEMSWRLAPGTDLVVETHMLPSGKPEEVQVSVGLYFTDKAPSKFPGRVLLHSEAIDIPAGAVDYEVGDSYVLPVAVQLLGIHPHAHLLGKEIEVWAILPDGTKKSLLRIPDWDFAWQNAYHFAHPVDLPEGTALSMRVRYDNSAANVRNPFQPPRRVHFGFHSYDEMAQMSVQVLPRNAEQARKLAADFQKRDLFATIKGYEFRLKFDADDVRLQTSLGIDLFIAGREQEALTHLKKAAELDPKNAEAHYYLGLGHSNRDELGRARAEFEAAIAADPDYYLALSELGSWHLQKGNLEQAKRLFLRSLKIHPEDAVTHNNLGIVHFQQHNLREANQEIRDALRIDPNYAPARDNLRKLEAMRKN